MARFVVGIGQTAVATAPGDLIEMIGLGSCAGIFVTVPGKIAVAAHALLATPREGETGFPPGKYVETAVPFVVEEITKAGIAKSRCKAWVVGGAQMFSFGSSSDSAGIGTRNTDLAVKMLRSAGFRPDSHFTGGTSARRAALPFDSGDLESSAAHD